MRPTAQLCHLPPQQVGEAGMEVKMEESDIKMTESDLAGLQLPADCAGVDAELYNFLNYDTGEANGTFSRRMCGFSRF